MAIENKYYSTSIQMTEELPGSHLDPGFQRILNQSTDLILKRALPLSTVDNEIPSRQVSSSLTAQISDVFSLALIGVNADSTEGMRVRSGVRPILESFLQGTHLRSVQHDSYLNLLYTSIFLARDPSLFQKLTISTGFGGSNDRDTNIRALSYVIPSVKILENLKKLRQRGIIEFDLPRFRIFFAPYSAIAVNKSEMSSEDVLQNMARTRRYILEYIAYFHKDIFPNIFIEVENPWDQHDPVTRVVLDYFSQLLVDSQDDTIRKLLSILQQRGANHGNELGAELSHVYAAIHPLLFKDSVNHPRVNVFDSAEKNLFALSIGGRPERLFNSVRAYIRKKTDPRPLSVLLEKNGVLPDPSSVSSVEPYTSIVFPIKPDYLSSPVASTLAITTIGSTPVYYRTKYDLGIRSHDDSPLSYFASMREIISRQLSGAERALELNRLAEIERDIRTVIDDVGSEDVLMSFLDNLDSNLDS